MKRHSGETGCRAKGALSSRGHTALNQSIVYRTFTLEYLINSAFLLRGYTFVDGKEEKRNVELYEQEY